MQNFRMKYLVLALLLTFLSIKIHASNCCDTHAHYSFEPECDLCGCSTSSGSFGFGSLKNSNFVGLRYIYQNFKSKDGIFNNSPSSEESFNTYQLWARVPVAKNFYLSSIVPYQDLHRKFEDRTEHINGLGDMNVVGWYQITFYKKQKKDEVVFSTERKPSGHRLQIGVGAKWTCNKKLDN
ncbi:hypothetical protein [Tamlana crocina]|uniref:Secreted protein n=1 Tax=Tamlana crocina TaxID=393006 RepID=A0ABX1DG43_9FLAO|nr:hypothetical protein [Tamlana crocina]NJX16714.1 hypothetical protein [Tamlana crocina]